jgi:hypothetical protein
MAPVLLPDVWINLVDVDLFIIITNAESQEMQVHLFLHHALVKVPPHHMQMEFLSIQS